MNLSELSNEELDRIAANEVLGWELLGGENDTIPYWSGYAMLTGDGCGTVCSWHPTTCRNQSRMVVEAAAKLLESVGRGAWWIDSDLIALMGNHDQPSPIWRIATPRQEVEAAILAVRASKGEEPT